MPSSEVRSFTDLDEYLAALPAPHVKGVLTGPGRFSVELTQINLHRVLLVRGEESLPRVVSATTSPLRASFFFATGPGQPAMNLNGMALSHGEIIAWDLRGVARQHRSSAASQWGQTSLRPEDTGGANMAEWHADWAWSLPLIVLTVVIHVLGLGLISERVVRVLSGILDHRRFTGIFVVVIGSTALLATILHGFEGVIWAAAYRVLGALPDAKSAMLYSLSAITSYGHANLYLEPHWQLMGALEALNGMLLFGLTTAFLFAMIQQIWPLGSRMHRRHH
jgi:hypothetical protein